jgi:hypothetical protein
MKLETAFNIIQKEAKFLGMSFTQVIKEAQKSGQMVYSKKVEQAAKLIAMYDY